VTLTLANFEESIDPTILQRGRSYYANGRVIGLSEIDTGSWQATVEGAYMYQVNVSIAPDGALDWSCDCPYDWGPVCKHVTAVLYGLEEAPILNDVTDPSAPGRPRKSQADRVRDALDALSDDQIHDLLLELVLKDRELTNLVLARYGSAEQGQEAYHQLVRDSLRVGQGRHDFLDYRGAIKAADGVYIVLGRAETYARQGQPAQAIVIYQAVIEEVVPAVAQADDSAGALSGCVSTALYGLQDLVGQLAPAARAELFDYCLSEAPKERYAGWDWRWDLVSIAVEMATTDQQRTALFAALDQIAVGRGDSGWLADYDQERAAEIKLSFIQRHEGDEAALAFLEEHIHHERLRMALARMHLQRGDLAMARQVCQEWLDHPDPGRPGLRKDFLAILLDIAEVSGDRSEQIRLADTLFLETDRFEYYELLKELIGPVRWVAYRPDFLGRASANRWVDMAELYLAEEMWDELLAYVQDRPYAAPRYHEQLGQRFPEELSTIYERLALDALASRVNRSGYQEACGYLRRMQALGQGERVAELVAQWREQYKRRSALMDELNKAFGH
jgi:uncharacterized Zn finger protein